MLGGWWADMDYFMLPNEPPNTLGKQWLLGTEYERRNSTYRKGDKNTMMLEGELVAVNLGIMWPQRDCPHAAGSAEQGESLVDKR